MAVVEDLLEETKSDHATMNLEIWRDCLKFYLDRPNSRCAALHAVQDPLSPSWAGVHAPVICNDFWIPKVCQSSLAFAASAKSRSCDGYSISLLSGSRMRRWRRFKSCLMLSQCFHETDSADHWDYMGVELLFQNTCCRHFMFTQVNISCRALLKIFLYLRESSPSRNGVLYGLLKTSGEVEVREYIPIPNNITNHQELMESGKANSLRNIYRLLFATELCLPVPKLWNGHRRLFDSHLKILKLSRKILPSPTNDLVVRPILPRTLVNRCVAFHSSPSFCEIPIHISMKTLDALLILNNRCTHVESPTALCDRMKRRMQNYSACMNFFINSCSESAGDEEAKELYVSALRLIKTSASASVPVSFE